MEPRTVPGPDAPRAPRSLAVLLAVAAGAGGLLALTAYAPHWALQLPAVVAAAAVLWLLGEAPPQRAYPVGVVFALAWLVPTTAWYYAFMSPPVAFAASVGWALLLANLFSVAGLRARVGRGGVWLLFAAAWLVLTAVRLHAPVVEDWWLPHLGYSVWRNSGLLWASRFGGEVLLEGLVLAAGAAVAAVLVRWGRLAGVAAVGAVIAVVLALDAASWAAPAKPVRPVVALQAMTRGGVDVPATAQDVADLSRLTLEAVGDQRPVTVVWPENSVPEDAHAQVAELARTHGLTIAFHTTETRPTGSGGTEVTKKVVVVDASGEVVLTNYKQHLAPDEAVGVPRASREQVTLDGQVVTAYVCYDLHYPDVVGRLRGADVAYVPLNDAAYGYLQKQFHTADIALHAAQADVTVVVASTNGPTVIVSSNGVVLESLAGSGPGLVRR